MDGRQDVEPVPFKLKMTPKHLRASMGKGLRSENCRSFGTDLRELALQEELERRGIDVHREEHGHAPIEITWTVTERFGCHIPDSEIVAD